MPTEEVFTSPDPRRTNGTFRCTFPLSFRGRLIHGLRGEFSNGRLVDMQQAATVLRGRRISPRVRLEVVPSSRRQFEDAMADGTLGVLSAAGAVIGSSGCGPCLGRTGGVLAGDEVCFSTANRNYRGRMGSPDASIYLGSPYVAAVAALTGVIDDPRPYLESSDADFDALVAKRREDRGDRGAASERSGDRSRELVMAHSVADAPWVVGMDQED
jgi:aconitase A